LGALGFALGILIAELEDLIRRNGRRAGR